MQRKRGRVRETLKNKYQAREDLLDQYGFLDTDDVRWLTAFEIMARSVQGSKAFTSDEINKRINEFDPSMLQTHQQGLRQKR
jgi:hypothetical protein